MKTSIAVIGYVGLFNAILLSQKNLVFFIFLVKKIEQ
jgi:hypothetical protein